MKLKILRLLTIFLSVSFAGCHSTDGGIFGRSSRLIGNLEAGKTQTVVAYGTSLTSQFSSFWFLQLREDLNVTFPGQAILRDRAFGMVTSDWGVENLDEAVLSETPDTVFIEFAINDSKIVNPVSIEKAESNLLNMLDRIQMTLPNCEIILMTMNPPWGINLDARPNYRAYYQMYRDVARRRHLLLIDHEFNWDEILNEDPALFNQYVPDTIHPNEEGSRAVITPEINRRLGLDRHLSTMIERAFRLLLELIPF